MARITPQEALQRASTAQQQGMRLAPAKTSSKKTVKQPVFAMEMNKDGLRSQYADKASRIYLCKYGSGGLILPADDEVSPILGECEVAEFTSALPPHFQAWLNGYAQEIEWLQNGTRLILGGEEDDAEDTPTAGEPKKDIPTMIKTKWGQGAPWNNKLVFDGKICLVGCPAVMVGQILKYWGDLGFHRGCLPTDPYQYKGYPVVPASPAVKMFDYANLPLTKSCTATQKEAVSSMLAKIGYALMTFYGESASGTSTTYITKYMKSRLRMGSKIQYVYCDKMGEQAFADTIYNDLAAGRPVGICAAHNSNGTVSGSHAFICDGYRAKDGKYHLNFGWDSYYDGYYALTAINLTKSDSFSTGKKAWIGIQPEYRLGDANRDGEVNITDVMTTINHAQKGTFDEAADVNADGKVTIADHTPIVNHILGKDPL